MLRMSFCRQARNRRFAIARAVAPFSRMVDRSRSNTSRKFIDEACVVFIPLALSSVPIRDRLPVLISATGEISLIFPARKSRPPYCVHALMGYIALKQTSNRRSQEFRSCRDLRCLSRRSRKRSNILEKSIRFVKRLRRVQASCSIRI